MTLSSRLKQREGGVGGLRLVTPLYQRGDSAIQIGAGPPALLGPRSRTPSTASVLVHPGEFLVRVGASIYASALPQHGKAALADDIRDTVDLLRFLIRIADLACGAVVLDEVVFTPGETKSYVVDLQWPPSGFTAMGANMGGFHAVERAATHGAPQSLLNNEQGADARNEFGLQVRDGQRLRQGKARDARIAATIKSLDWAARDASDAPFDVGENLDKRHGLAPLGWLHLPPGATHSGVEAANVPIPMLIATKKIGSIRRPLSPADVAFSYRWLGDFSDPAAPMFVSGTSPSSKAQAFKSGINLRLTNTSGSTFELKGVVPLRAISQAVQAVSIVNVASSAWFRDWAKWYFAAPYT